MNGERLRHIPKEIVYTVTAIVLGLAAAAYAVHTSENPSQIYNITFTPTYTPTQVSATLIGKCIEGRVLLPGNIVRCGYDQNPSQIPGQVPDQIPTQMLPNQIPPIPLH